MAKRTARDLLGEEDMKPIEEGGKETTNKVMSGAPKNRVILLYLPEFGTSSSTWWPGIWSYLEMRWVIRTPFTVKGKMLMVKDVPNPIGWQPLPEKPE